MKLFILFSLQFLIASSYAQNQTCPDGQVPCEGTVDECVPEEFICDGTFIDCSNDADEERCPCGPEYFQCDTFDCLPLSWVCDGYRNCPGGEDEVGDCPACGANQFTCDDLKCIPRYMVCDGLGNCANGEDERQDCPPCDGFFCTDGDCLPQGCVCDGWPGCSNDEVDCPFPCDGVLCPNGQCIRSEWVCDGYVQCFGGWDETNCTTSAVPAVPYNRRNLMANARDVEMRKSIRLVGLFHSEIITTEKKVREEQRESLSSDLSRRNSME